MDRRKNRKGVFFGLTTVDIFNGLSCHPAPNQKIRADWQEIYAGGPAANAAVAYAALGNSSHLCSGVGSHPIAQLAITDLAEHQVKLHDYAGNSRQPPVISTIMVDSTSGDRCVVYTDTSSMEPLRRFDGGPLLEGASVLLCDGFYADQAGSLAGMAREMGVTTVLDGGSWKGGTLNLLPSMDYAICSADFLPPDCYSSEDVLAFLADHGVYRSAISRGELPLLVNDSGSFGSIEVPSLDAVDTLGAGDILHGAFCHFIGFNSFSSSLKQAAAVASGSCRYRGTRKWIRNQPPGFDRQKG